MGPVEPRPVSNEAALSYRLGNMNDVTAENSVKIRAHSPGEYPILVVELPTGDLRTVYRETGYDLERSKPVSGDWLRENAIGRHEFVAVDPPEEAPVTGLEDYVRRELLGER